MKFFLRRTIRLGLITACVFINAANTGTATSQSRQLTLSEDIIEWDKVKEGFSLFYECPSPENAKSLMKSLPAGAVSKQVGDFSEATYFIMKYYTILEMEVLAGNRYAAEVLFRLLSLSDGALAMDILDTMGMLIRVHPKLFLDMVIVYRESPFIKDRYPVYAVRPAYREKKRSSIYEYEMRIEALESVSGSKYTEVIGECVRELRTMIFRLSL